MSMPSQYSNSIAWCPFSQRCELWVLGYNWYQTLHYISFSSYFASTPVPNKIKHPDCLIRGLELFSQVDAAGNAFFMIWIKIKGLTSDGGLHLVKAPALVWNHQIQQGNDRMRHSRTQSSLDALGRQMLRCCDILLAQKFCVKDTWKYSLWASRVFWIHLYVLW